MKKFRQNIPNSDFLLASLELDVFSIEQSCYQLSKTAFFERNISKRSRDIQNRTWFRTVHDLFFHSSWVPTGPRTSSCEHFVVWFFTINILTFLLFSSLFKKLIKIEKRVETPNVHIQLALLNYSLTNLLSHFWEFFKFNHFNQLKL